MTPLLGPDQRTYALAQGPLLVGGYRFDADLNQQQRNYPTTAVLQGGGTIEAPVESTRCCGAATRLRSCSQIRVSRRRSALPIRSMRGSAMALRLPGMPTKCAFISPACPARSPASWRSSRMSGSSPPSLPRIVINERTGTVVAGGDVMISSVAIAFFFFLGRHQGDGDRRAHRIAARRRLLWPPRERRQLARSSANTKLEVAQGWGTSRSAFPTLRSPTSSRALVSRAGMSTRRMISILQAIKTAMGALHAEIIDSVSVKGLGKWRVFQRR